MSDSATRLREAVIEHAVRGPAHASVASRRAAFDNSGVDERARTLIDKVARNAWKVTASDVSAAKSAGLPEEEIFELTICAALGQSSRQLQSALLAIDAASEQEP